MNRIGPQEIRAILAVTDAMRIHRESVRVPLLPRGEGSLRVTEVQQVEIVVPATTEFAVWLAQLGPRLEALDLSHVRRSD